MVCLLHEKPFSGMNGSGKHNNWSLSAPGYGSLLNPGSSPQENAIFLTLLCATIKAVDEHADLLRASVAKSGNEHRLGAHEAPRPSFPSSWEICWMKSLSKSRKEALKSAHPKDHQHRRGHPAHVPPGRLRPEPHQPVCLHRQ